MSRKRHKSDQLCAVSYLHGLNTSTLWGMYAFVLFLIFIVNELDGLSANAGMFTISTTNHPEKIDDAIINRLSRFDVKYDSTLPNVVLPTPTRAPFLLPTFITSDSRRKAFAKKWIAKFGGSEEEQEVNDLT